MANKIGILIVDDDEASQSALRQVLDSEGWYVRIVPVLNDALAELSSGEWSLVIVNIAMTGLCGPCLPYPEGIGAGACRRRGQGPGARAVSCSGSAGSGSPPDTGEGTAAQMSLSLSNSMISWKKSATC